MDRKLSAYNVAVKRGAAVDADVDFAGSIDLADLSTGITPSHIVKFAGTHTYGGGGTSDAATVTGVAATDIVHATIKAATNACYLAKAVPTTNTVTFHFSADPGASTQVFYTVLNAAA